MKRILLVLLCLGFTGCVTASKLEITEKKVSELQEALLKKGQELKAAEDKLEIQAHRLKEKELEDKKLAEDSKEKELEIKNLRKKLEGFGVFNN